MNLLSFELLSENLTAKIVSIINVIVNKADKPTAIKFSVASKTVFIRTPFRVQGSTPTLLQSFQKVKKSSNHPAGVKIKWL